MNQTQKERWAKIRANGEFRYVLLRGILSYGLIPLIARILLWLFYILRNGESRPIIEDAALVIITSLLFAIGGYFSASKVWSRQEKEYVLAE